MRHFRESDIVYLKNWHFNIYLDYWITKILFLFQNHLVAEIISKELRQSSIFYGIIIVFIRRIVIL